MQAFVIFEKNLSYVSSFRVTDRLLKVGQLLLKKWIL